MIPEGARSAEEKNKMGAGKYRFSFMKAPTPAKMVKSPKLAGKSCQEIRLHIALWDNRYKH